MKKHDLITLDDLDLAAVTGGTHGGTHSSSGIDSQLLTTLQGIQSSLDDLGKNQNGLFGNNSALLFMTMALAFSRRGDVSVSSGPRGWSWRANW